MATNACCWCILCDSLSIRAEPRLFLIIITLLHSRYSCNESFQLEFGVWVWISVFSYYRIYNWLLLTSHNLCRLSIYMPMVVCTFHFASRRRKYVQRPLDPRNATCTWNINKLQNMCSSTKAQQWENAWPSRAKVPTEWWMAWSEQEYVYEPLNGVIQWKRVKQLESHRSQLTMSSTLELIRKSMGRMCAAFFRCILSYAKASDEQHQQLQLQQQQQR